MSYAELLKHPLWQKRRLEIFVRDNWTCQRCDYSLADAEKEGNTANQFHAHHTIYFYKRKPWDYEDKYLYTLCSKCHDYETKHLKTAWQLLRESISGSGLFSDEIYALANTDFKNTIK